MGVGMRYQLFSDLEGNFGIHFLDDSGEVIHEITEDPKTKKNLIREDAIALAEKISNPPLPKTKQDFFESFSDDDFEKYIEAQQEIDNRYFSELGTGITEKTRRLKVIFTKFDLLPSVDLSENDIETLKILCKEFNIDAIKTV